MIKIKANKVEVVTEYDVEPKVATLYFANQLNKDIVEYKNCIFKEAAPVGWGANDPNKYLLKYENKHYLHVKVDIKTGVVKDDSDYFFEYEQAVKIYRERRIKFLKDRIVALKDGVTRLKEYQKELEELEK